MTSAPVLQSPLREVDYDICGVPLVVETNLPEVRSHIAMTYAAFETKTPTAEAPEVVGVERRSGDFLLIASDGTEEIFTDEHAAALAALTRVSHLVVHRLAAAGTLAVHAGAVARPGNAVIMAGPCGSGKSTLALGLASSGLGLLSDEFALIPPHGEDVLPYRRSVHVRPGTPELIPALAFLHEEPQVQLGGGITWSITPQELEQAIPDCLGGPAPLTHVLLLEPPAPDQTGPQLTPVPPAVAVVELAHGTPAARDDLGYVLRRLGGLLASASCARLYRGNLDETLDLVMSWIDDG